MKGEAVLIGGIVVILELYKALAVSYRLPGRNALWGVIPKEVSIEALITGVLHRKDVLHPQKFIVLD